MALPEQDPDALADEVAALLRDRGERMTRPRRAVLAALARDGAHLTAEEIVDAVAGIDPSVHRASVYRTLETLTHTGVVQHLHLGHGGTAYHLVAGGGPHLHAQCRVCGGVQDLPADLLNAVTADIAERYGFRLDPSHVALSGTCADCAAKGDATKSQHG